MRIAVCDDNEQDLKELGTYINKYCRKKEYDVEIKKFVCGDELLSEFKQECFDVVFLDIYMPGTDGLETARSIRELSRDCVLIFITRSQNHAMDGFKVKASGYLVKPWDTASLDDILHLCREKFQINSRIIEVPYERTTISVAVSNILYVEVYGRKTMFHTTGGDIDIRLPLEEVDKILGPPAFLRCHRSYIINLNHVADIRIENVLMDNGDIVPMRKNGRKVVRTEIANFIAGAASGVI